jgi:manganese efflux pump family protein
MSPFAIVVLSLSMSTDAFAAAVARGASQRPNLASALKAAIVFGIIEAITPLVGWVLGYAASGYVEKIDHWIAFFLLSAVGLNMIWQAVRASDDASDEKPSSGGPWLLIGTALGTSIDAGAVGVGLALIDANIWIIAASIGLSTFALTAIGMMIGKAVGVRFGKIAELLGGVALIGIGGMILFEHLSARIG